MSGEVLFQIERGQSEETTKMGVPDYWGVVLIVNKKNKEESGSDQRREKKVDWIYSQDM